MDDRLFCIDIAVENLTILRNASMPNDTPTFSSASLIAQFLAFSPLHLTDDLAGTLLRDSRSETKIFRLQTGKSALLRSKRRNLIEHLNAGHLVLALVGNAAEDASPIVLLSAHLNLTAAAAYFLQNENGQDDQGSSKFTSAGVIDLKDDLGRKRAELQIGYRLWQLGASMDDFFSQHEPLDQSGATAAWLPTFPTDHRSKSAEHGPNAVENVNATADKKTSVLSDVEIQTDGHQKDGSASSSVSVSGESSKDSNASGRRSGSGGKSSATSSSSSKRSQRSASIGSAAKNSVIATNRPIAASDTYPSNLTQEDWLQPLSRGDRETAVRRLISELERLTRTNAHQNAHDSRNIDKQIRTIARPNQPLLRSGLNHCIQRRLADEEIANRQREAIQAYGPILTGPTNKSFNLYSKLYLTKANGFGMTRSYLQRLAYLPLYHGSVAVSVPRPAQITKKIYMKDEATLCDLATETAATKAMTSETQTEYRPTSERRRSSSVRSRRQPEAALTLNEIRLLIQTMSQNPTRTSAEAERPRTKRLLSIGQRSVSAFGQRRQSAIRPPPMSSSRASRSGAHTGKVATRSPSLSSIKSETPSRGPSPFTESVATALEGNSSESDASVSCSSVPEQLYSSDATSRSSQSSKQSVATALEQPVGSSRRQLRVASAETLDIRSRVISYETASSARFGDTLARNSASQTETPESGKTPVLAKGDQPEMKSDESVAPLSPVSEYLREFRLREAARQRQLSQRAMSIRTESVSSYMPSDVDHLAYSSTPSPLHMSGAKVHS